MHPIKLLDIDVKILSLTVILSSLYWTWNLIHPLPLVEPSTQVAIRDEVQQVIIETIKEKHQTAQDIEFTKIEAESLSPREVLIHFKYSFRHVDEAEAIRSQIQGNVMIKLRTPHDGTAPQWEMGEIQKISSELEFERGSEILSK